MKQPDLHHLKSQLDRIILFSDAVFAIAITLLIIEVKVPELHGNATDHDLLEELTHMIGKFVGVLVSFLIVGRYWVFHHRLFGYVKNYNAKLIWTNLWFLLSIVLMPFSTGVYSEYFFSTMKLPVMIYTFNICFTAFMNIRLIDRVSNKHDQLAPELTDRKLLHFFRVRATLAPGMFIFTVFISFVSVTWAYILPIFFPLISGMVNRYYRKRHPEFFQV